MKSRTRCVASPHDTSPSTRWNSSVSSPHSAAVLAEHTEVELFNHRWCHDERRLAGRRWQLLEVLSYYEYGQCYDYVATDTTNTGPRTRPRAFRRMDQQNEQRAACYGQQQTAIPRWWPSSRRPSWTPTSNMLVVLLWLAKPNMGRLVQQEHVH